MTKSKVGGRSKRGKSPLDAYFAMLERRVREADEERDRNLAAMVDGHMVRLVGQDPGHRTYLVGVMRTQIVPAGLDKLVDRLIVLLATAATKEALVGTVETLLEFGPGVVAPAMNSLATSASRQQRLGLLAVVARSAGKLGRDELAKLRRRLNGAAYRYDINSEEGRALAVVVGTLTAKMNARP